MSLGRCTRLLGIAAVAVLAGSCGGESGSGPALNRIVFSSDRALPPQVESATFDTRRLDLYVMEANGSHIERLTENFLTDVFPAVSREGRHVAFTRDIRGYAQVFVIDPARERSAC
jgi:Tol biopolymer transport system component